MAIFSGHPHRARRGMRCLLVEMARKINPRHQRLLWTVALAGVAALVDGCAAMAPLGSAVSSVNPAGTVGVFNTTEVLLQQKNFVIVKSNVIGQSKGFSLLGFITIVPAEFNKAMSRLNAQADLKPGTPRTLMNLALENESSYFILFSRPRTTIRADVIEFTPSTQPLTLPGETKANAKQ
jgi:hypothetical protein